MPRNNSDVRKAERKAGAWRRAETRAARTSLEQYVLVQTRPGKCARELARLGDTGKSTEN